MMLYLTYLSHMPLFGRGSRVCFSHGFNIVEQGVKTHRYGCHPRRPTEYVREYNDFLRLVFTGKIICAIFALFWFQWDHGGTKNKRNLQGDPKIPTQKRVLKTDGIHKPEQKLPKKPWQPSAGNKGRSEGIHGG